MTSSLVGSEMCIRDSPVIARPTTRSWLSCRSPNQRSAFPSAPQMSNNKRCLLYTSDAADDM
eukprot:5024081-Prorocentrum_lima.AAC.1